MFDQPDTEWMLWTGIGVTVLDVLIGIGVASMSYRGGVRSERLRATGVRGFAEVTSMGQTGVEINNQPLMSLGLRISGSGLVPFEVNTRTVVPIFRQPALYRRRLAVLVDPASQEFEIDWEATESMSDPMPSTGLSEGGTRTFADRLSSLDDLYRIGALSETNTDAPVNGSSTNSEPEKARV
ncbi:SHOCT domain-containing protein [Gordonia alkanivorans]|uniref:SHOCT domain-containing protein n=1 Tax=Gordonia alkanivorans TaxID=84096 RepID=UPI00244AE6BC|nr:SHOCT domain-containing protein [Gordonia alkanivorans]MDH3024034.1 SHOCT domain-containing protein [Gordonia alkanivorans]